MGPHYPSGAELAQFRMRIGGRCVNCYGASCPAGGCATYNPDELAPVRRSAAEHPASVVAFDHPGHGGAWLTETAQGIGWSAGTEWPLLDGRPAWQDARALAGAMRSRAASRCPACGIAHSAGIVWHGGMGHRFIGTDDGSSCYRCGIIVHPLDPARETLVPDCDGPDNSARHIWTASPDGGIECANGCPAYVRADGTGAWTFVCN